MTIELSILAWACILAIVHIFATIRFKTRQYGSKWNMGARDEELPPLDPIAGRLSRAQANFFETFPIAIAAILIVHAGHLESRWTALGAITWLAARIVYMPLYALGVPVLRTIVFMISLVGLAMVIRPALVFSFG